MGGEYELNLVAGFIGVRQDPALGVLQPEIGWAVHRSILPRSQSIELSKSIPNSKWLQHFPRS
jgi:hypothetical protein